MLKIATAMSLTVLVALTAANARANLLTNGGFETTTPVVAAGSFQNFVPGSSGISGWSVVGNSGTDVSVVNTTFTQDGFTFPSEEGNNWLDLTGDGSNNSSEGVSQTVTTIVGDQYTLSFDVGNVYDPSGIFGTTSTTDVSAGGVSLGAFENSCTPCTMVLEWKPFTTTFTATSTSTTVQFLNGDPTGDNSNGLDNVALLDDGKAPVPEPSSLAFVSLGLLGLAGYVRRRTVQRER